MFTTAKLMKKTKEKEHYIKEIYKLELEKSEVTVSKLSALFNISKSSVSNMIKKLVVMELLSSAPYKSIELTNKGRVLGQRIVAKHRLIDTFLVEIMHFDRDEVHDIAEEIEQIESPPFFRQVKSMLKQNKIDPHGAPIPDVDF
jgi:DtxR family Mn-dependent transcriptional regulator